VWPCCRKHRFHGHTRCRQALRSERSIRRRAALQDFLAATPAAWLWVIAGTIPIRVRAMRAWRRHCSSTTPRVARRALRQIHSSMLRFPSVRRAIANRQHGAGQDAGRRRYADRPRGTCSVLRRGAFRNSSAFERARRTGIRPAVAFTAPTAGLIGTLLRARAIENLCT